MNIDTLATPTLPANTVNGTVVQVVWQNVLQSDVLAQLSDINPPPSGSFIDYRYWACGILRWALNQTDGNGQPLYAFGIPSWETGFDSNNDPVVGAFLFPVGAQITLLNPSDDELNTALAKYYHNAPPPLTLTSAQTGDPDERRWASAAHAYALSQKDANGKAYVAGIPSWEMSSDGTQTYRGVYAFSASSGIQVLPGGRAALMDQIIEGILQPLDNPNLMDTDMRTLAVAASRWAIRYGAVCGAATFGYGYSYFLAEGNFIYTHDIVICFNLLQPTGDLLQSIVNQPAVPWPDFGDAYAGLCTDLGNDLNNKNPMDPRALAAASASWDSIPTLSLLLKWLQFDSLGNPSLSSQAPAAPQGVSDQNWLNIIYTVWLEMGAVGQLQSVYNFAHATMNSAQTAADEAVNGVITNIQAKTEDSVVADIGQLLKDIGYSLVWFFPGVGAALANFAVVVMTDVVKIITAPGGGSGGSQITIGQYWVNMEAAFTASLTQLDNFYTTIAGDHGRLMAFYDYVDTNSLVFPTDADSDTVTAFSNGMLLQTYQTLMPLYWAVGWATPKNFAPGNHQYLYGSYEALVIPFAPAGTYVEGPYYEFALIWSKSGAIKSYPTPPMMKDLTTTLNLNLLDILARSAGWVKTPAWYGWVLASPVVLHGPNTR